MIAHRKDGTIAPWHGEAVNGIKHPLNIEQLWSDAELLAAGLYRVVLFTPADGMKVSGAPRYELFGDVVQQVFDVIEIPPTVVDSVTAAQAKVSLYNAGLLPTVTQAMEQAYPPAKIFFDHAPEWHRDHPYVQGFAMELGFDDAQLDALFEAASKL